jgi:hypothetical protein
MKSLVMVICGLFVIMNAINAGISTELPVSYLGELFRGTGKCSEGGKSQKCEGITFCR